MSLGFDPERRLYVPGRRAFLFLTGAALAGTQVPGWLAPALEPASRIHVILASPARDNLAGVAKHTGMVAVVHVEIPGGLAEVSSREIRVPLKLVGPSPLGGFSVSGLMPLLPAGSKIVRSELEPRRIQGIVVG